MVSTQSYPIALYFSGRELKDMDISSKSDPQCIILQKDGQWFEKGRTEVIQNNLNPEWTQNIVIDYMFESRQEIKILVVDSDEASTEKIGSIKTTLAEIVSQPMRIYTIFKDSNPQGKIIVKSERARGLHYRAIIQLSGLSLSDKDLFSKSDPFYRLFRVRSSNDLLKVYESEVIDDNLNPQWNSFEISVQELCNGDYEAPLKLQVFDYDSESSAEFIGEAFTCLKDILDKRHLELTDGKRQTGTILVKEATTVQDFTFLEYVRGGTQINLITAIDFTSSNGEANDPTSLHFCDPEQLNHYEKAIMSLGSILENYDSDKLFPTFGFGGLLGESSEASHCFALNNDEENPQVPGVRGILECYRNSLTQIQLSGPTYFKDVIRRSIDISQSVTPGHSYFVLLILTDGDIMDMQETIDSLVTGSECPLSVIIIGVGNEAFSKMIILDCDRNLLTDSEGKKAIRDIVQFVPFAKFQDNPDELARQVLAEVPRQLEEYMQSLATRKYIQQ